MSRSARVSPEAETTTPPDTSTSDMMILRCQQYARHTGVIAPVDEIPSDDEFDPDFDPDRLVSCNYWRCGELFEARTANHRYCRKACRSRQKKWERAELRRVARQTARNDRNT